MHETALGWAFCHQNNKRHHERKKKKNIVEHNLSFAVKKTRDNPAKTPTYTRRDTGDPTLRLKISLNL